MTIHDPELDAPAEPPTDAPAAASIESPADAGDRLRDAEDALRTFYGRLVEAESELATETVRAQRAEDKLAITESRLRKQNEALANAARVSESEAHFRARTAELDQELTNAHAEIHALHNSRTMRAVAFPRRIYAKLRSILR